MQLVEELNRSLRSKNLKRAYNIYSRMQARAYPEALLDASLQRIKRTYALINDNPTAYGFENDLEVFRLGTTSIKQHQFYSHIEAISEDLKVNGWCFSGLDGSKEASFLVVIEDQPYRIFRTSILRGDVSGKFKASGYWGYEFTLPSDVVNMAREEGKLKIEIRSPYGESFEEQTASEVIHFGQGTESKIFPIAEAEEVMNSFKNLDPKKISLNTGTPVSIILLNLNGGDMVVHSIQSIVDKMRPNDELIVVDHGSDDGSIEQVQDLISQGYDNIIMWERGKNYTFSESNNSAVKKAKNEIIVFINNDIVLEDGTFDDLSKVLGEEKIEIVGGLLYDAPIEEFSVKYKNSFPRCLQHRGIGLRIGGENFIQAYDINTPYTPKERETDYLQVVATTGALMAIRKEFFLNIGGFSEKYIYGQEDVDICLRASLKHDAKIAVSNKFKALHYHGYTRLRQNSKHRTKGLNLLKNRIILNDYFDIPIRNKLKDKNFLDHIDPVKARCKRIAFIVSDLSIKTSKGDVFTAFELASALNKKYNCECYFLLPNKNIDCEKFDIIINFIHSARVDLLENLRSDTIIIGWMRNWFDKWCHLPDIDMYDMIYCSSKYACSYVEDQIKFSVKYLPLAAGADAVKLGKERKLKQINNEKTKSYTFVGSYFNSPREITKLLDPTSIPYTFKLYGHNWEKHGKFSAYTLGPIDYFDTVEKYLETNLVVDDANIATKKWGSVNCRVFDSIALGINVITNGTVGAAEMFGGIISTYDSKESLSTNIIKSLEAEESNSIKTLQDIVLNEHTYDNRAEQIWNDIEVLLSSKHVRIHTSIPKPSYSLQWGDLYLARAIRYELQKSNLRCNISVGENDERRLSSREDLALNLRGIESVKQLNKQNFLNWFISHPESYEISELVELDNIAVSSKIFTHKIESLRSGFNNIQPLYLPQFSTIKPPETPQETICDFIFVGNTRNIYRESVKYAIQLGLDVRVIGSGWDNYIDEKYILKNLVSNSELGSAYALGRVVLCDHWDDMKKFGFVSNRIYDCLSIGRPVLTDYAEDIESDLTDDEKKYIFTYDSFEGFREQSKNALLFSNKILDTDNSLDSKSAYKGLEMITDHLKTILNSQ